MALLEKFGCIQGALPCGASMSSSSKSRKSSRRSASGNEGNPSSQGAEWLRGRPAQRALKSTFVSLNISVPLLRLCWLKEAAGEVADGADGDRLEHLQAQLTRGCQRLGKDFCAGCGLKVLGKVLDLKFLEDETELLLPVESCDEEASLKTESQAILLSELGASAKRLFLDPISDWKIVASTARSVVFRCRMLLQESGDDGSSVRTRDAVDGNGNSQSNESSNSSSNSHGHHGDDNGNGNCQSSKSYAQEVAVKVRRQDIRRSFLLDAFALQNVIRVGLGEKSSTHQRLDKYLNKIQQELDYWIRAEAQEKFAEEILRKAPGVQVPRVCWEATSPKVLTTTWIGGSSLRRDVGDFNESISPIANGLVVAAPTLPPGKLLQLALQANSSTKPAGD